MKITRKIIALMLAALCAFSLCACGSDTSEDSDDAQSYTFEISDGPTVVIALSDSSEYTLTTETEEGEFVLTGSAEAETSTEGGSAAESVYGAFKTIDSELLSTLSDYPDYEETAVGDDFEGFFIQANEDEYDLLILLKDDVYLCLYSADEDTDLMAAAEQLEIDVK